MRVLTCGNEMVREMTKLASLGVRKGKDVGQELAADVNRLVFAQRYSDEERQWAQIAAIAGLYRQMHREMGESIARKWATDNTPPQPGVPNGPESQE